MDQAHTRALAALQPFIHLALTTKSPSPRFLADLISQATSAPGTYVFTELLQTPAIQTLRSADTPPEFQAHLTALELFSYGTYEEYKKTPKLPTLSDAQTLKLRQLTLLTLASSPTPLTYANLTNSLALPSSAALETLITQSIYSGLLTARLSPTSTPPTIHITSVAPLRDLGPASLPSMLSILSVWESRCSTTIANLESQISTIRSAAAKTSAQARSHACVIDQAVLAEDGKKELGDAKGTAQRTRSGNARGNKRDLEEQLEGDDDEFEVSSGDGGGIGSGVAGMQVDENTSGRTNKRNTGKRLSFPGFS